MILGDLSDHSDIFQTVCFTELCGKVAVGSCGSATGALEARHDGLMTFPQAPNFNLYPKMNM